MLVWPNSQLAHPSFSVFGLNKPKEIHLSFVLLTELNANKNDVFSLIKGMTLEWIIGTTWANLKVMGDFAE
jgi:hypothetical protein